MKPSLAWLIAPFLCLPFASASSQEHWQEWNEAYHQALKSDDRRALSMLPNRYNTLPPGTEKLYVSSKLHGFMTLKGQPYYGNDIAFNPEYSKLEQAFIAGLNGESKLDFNTAHSQYISLLEQANVTNDIQGKILFEYHLCRSLNMQGQYYNAQFYCNALKTHLADVENSILPNYDALRVIANNLEFTGHYQESLATYQKYLATIPSFVDPSGVYNDAGLLLKEMGQLELAEEYLSIAIDLRQSVNSALELAQSHHSMGKVLFASNNYHGALSHLEQSKAILDEYQHVYGLSHVTLALGKTYAALKEYALASNQLNKALNYANTQGNDQILGDVYLAFSDMSRSQQDYQTAQNYADKAYILAEKIHSERLRALSMRTKAELAELQGNYLVALQHYQDYFDSELSKRTKSSRSAFLALDLAQREFNQRVRNDQTTSVIDSLKSDISELSQQRQFYFLLITLLVISVIVQFFLYRSKSKKAQMDQLTGALNRAATIKKVRSISKPKSDVQAHVVILLDLDDFKAINDTYGHPTGDRALSAVANVICSTKREGDVFGRLGGEEFVVVMKNVDELDIRDRVEELRHSIAEQSFIAENKEKLHMTASFSYLASIKALNEFDEIYSVLDQALYQAKKNGKNQIIDAYNEPIYVQTSAYASVQPL